jgi:hypothetical protein
MHNHLAPTQFQNSVFEDWGDEDEKAVCLAHLSECKMCREMLEAEREVNPLYALWKAAPDKKAFWNNVTEEIKKGGI